MLEAALAGVRYGCLYLLHSIKSKPAELTLTKYFYDSCFSLSKQVALHKKWSFRLRISSDLVTFTKEILNGKLHFLCSAVDSDLSCLTSKIRPLRTTSGISLSDLTWPVRATHAVSQVMCSTLITWLFLTFLGFYNTIFKSMRAKVVSRRFWHLVDYACRRGITVT